MENKQKVILGGAAALLLYAISKTEGYQAPAPTIYNIVDELEKHPTKTYNTRSLSQIQKIIVHHYAANGTPYQVAHYHVKPDGRDWPGIGYHFTISKDGTIHQVNNLNTISYHVANHNTSSIGVALEGNFQNENPTPAQMASLNALIPFIRTLIAQPLPVFGHSDFANKPYDPNIDLSPYAINGVYSKFAPGLHQCQDGTYTDLTGQGSCANHGGIYDPIKDITQTDLETYFYKDYNIAAYLAAEKVDPESWRMYGDSQLSKEKFMWLKEGGAQLDQSAQELSDTLGIEVTPQDFVDVILVSDNPHTYINELRAEIWQIYQSQGIGAVYSKQQRGQMDLQNQCNDGTFTTAYRGTKGVCQGHGGLMKTAKDFEFTQVPAIQKMITRIKKLEAVTWNQDKKDKRYQEEFKELNKLNKSLQRYTKPRPTKREAKATAESMDWFYNLGK